MEPTPDEQANIPAVNAAKDREARGKMRVDGGVCDERGWYSPPTEWSLLEDRRRMARNVASRWITENQQAQGHSIKELYSCDNWQCSENEAIAGGSAVIDNRRSSVLVQGARKKQA